MRTLLSDCRLAQVRCREGIPERVAVRGEITRRFALAGIEATKRLTEEGVKHQAHRLRSTQHVAGPEGDKPQGNWF
jgi:hypothetical protein